MKHSKLLIILLMTMAIAGCSSITPCNTDNELVCDLHEKGIDQGNTRRLVFEGSESNFGRIRVEINDAETIDEVWSMINNCSSGGRHYACGWVKIEFYNSEYRSKPNAKMELICGGDDAGVVVEEAKRTIYDKKKMSFVGLYHCAGLEQYVLKSLEKEYHKTHPKQ
jgi:hypothetical protein